jgi:hypothetical protein
LETLSLALSSDEQAAFARSAAVVRGASDDLNAAGWASSMA